MKPRLWIILIALIGGLSILEKGFYRPENLLNILLQVSIDGILACGMTLVVLTSGLDLSIGSVMALSGVVFVMASHYGVLQGGILALATGVAVGTLNGFLIGRLHLNSLIVTLGAMAVVQGAVLWLSGGYPLPGPGSDFEIPGGGFLLYVPLPIVYFVLVAIACYLLLRYTQWGRNVYAVGGNRGAARVAQIPIVWTEWSVYVMSAGLAAFAGVVLASRLNTGSPIIGQDAPLQAFVAVTLGGTSLSGGKGGVAQTVVGVLVLGVLSNGLNLLNVPPALQWVIKGSLLIVFAAMESAPRLGLLRAAKELA
jgi:ribose transport system permease protein